MRAPTKRPCSVCRRWFEPNPRVGDRQRTCGDPTCRREQKRRTQGAWSARNPAYWTERRLRAQAERLATEGAPLRGPPAALREIPLDFAQDAMSAEALVIIVLFARLQHRAAQDAMLRHLAEITTELARLRLRLAQAETEAQGRGS